VRRRRKEFLTAHRRMQPSRALPACHRGDGDLHRRLHVWMARQRVRRKFSSETERLSIWGACQRLHRIVHVAVGREKAFSRDHPKFLGFPGRPAAMAGFTRPAAHACRTLQLRTTSSHLPARESSTIASLTAGFKLISSSRAQTSPIGSRMQAVASGARGIVHCSGGSGAMPPSQILRRPAALRCQQLRSSAGEPSTCSLYAVAVMPIASQTAHTGTQLLLSHVVVQAP
jgi:hypothetical protein